MLVDSCGFLLGVSMLRFFVSLHSVCRVLIADLSLYSVCPFSIAVRVTLQCMSCFHSSACHSTVYVLLPSQCVSLYSLCPVPILVRVTAQCMSCFHPSACHSTFMSCSPPSACHCTVYVLLPSQCVSLYSVCPVSNLVRVTLHCMSCSPPSACHSKCMSYSHRSACHSTVYVLFPS